MIELRRGIVVDVSLDPVKGSETGKTRPCVVVTNGSYNERVPVVQVVPVTEWTERKGRILTNVTLAPAPQNGLDKFSVADCLQTRPVDRRARVVRVRGELSAADMQQIDVALRLVFAL